MPGVGHGGPARGDNNLKRRLTEARRHYSLIEEHIEPPSEEQKASIRDMVSRKATTPEESAMLLSMLLGDD